MVGQRLVERAFAGEQRHDVVLEAAQPDALAVALRLVLRLDLPRQAADQRTAGGADVVGERPRGRVVAGDQAPQHAVLDDGEGGRRPDAHVAEIHEVLRRYAAQAAVAHVQRRWRGPGRPQGGGLVRDVGDHAAQVADIERARLAWDVRCRKMVVEEGVQALPPVLGQHLAGVVVEEAVHHYPVKPGEPPELDGCRLAQGGERRGAFERGRGGGQPVHHARGGQPLGGRRLQLDHRIRRAGIGGDVQRLAAGRAQLADEAACGSRRGVLGDFCAQLIADQHAQWLICPSGDAQASLDIPRDMPDAEVSQLRDEHHAIGLDGARRLDRLQGCSTLTNGGE